MPELGFRYPSAEGDLSLSYVGFQGPRKIYSPSLHDSLVFGK